MTSDRMIVISNMSQQGNLLAVTKFLLAFGRDNMAIANHNMSQR